MYIFKKNILKSFYVALALILVSSCSLMKLSVESNDIPLPKSELNTRIAVRAFQNEFATRIIKVSDSLISSTVDVQTKLNIIDFKMGLVAASGKTAFQSVPELSLVDTWVLCKQFVDVIKSDFGKEYLGNEYHLLEVESLALEKQISGIAKSLLNQERYMVLNAFVTKFTKENPVTSFNFPRSNILSPLSQHLGVADTSYVKTLGSGAEALSDIGDRIGIAKEQIGQQLEWEKQRLALKWGDANPSEEFLSRVDSLSLLLDRLALVAEKSPELAGEVSANLRNELMPLINNLNNGLDSSIGQLSEERIRMQIYIDEQRELLIKDINASGKQMINEGARGVSNIIKEVSWIIVLCSIILIALFFGIPFLAGYYLAKAKFKKNA